MLSQGTPPDKKESAVCEQLMFETARYYGLDDDWMTFYRKLADKRNNQGALAQPAELALSPEESAFVQGASERTIVVERTITPPTKPGPAQRLSPTQRLSPIMRIMTYLQQHPDGSSLPNIAAGLVPLKRESIEHHLDKLKNRGEIYNKGPKWFSGSRPPRRPRGTAAAAAAITPAAEPAPVPEAAAEPQAETVAPPEPTPVRQRRRRGANGADAKGISMASFLTAVADGLVTRDQIIGKHGIKANLLGRTANRCHKAGLTTGKGLENSVWALTQTGRAQLTAAP